MVDRCAEQWDGTQCELIAGHRSAHAARSDQALVTWRNHYAGGDATTIDLTWADEPVD